MGQARSRSGYHSSDRTARFLKLRSGTARPGNEDERVILVSATEFHFS